MNEKVLAILEKRYPLMSAKKEDLDTIVDIYTTVWNPKETKEQLRERFYKRFFQNPYSKGFESITVCKDKGRIIGYGGLLNFKLSYHGQILPAAYSIDVAILSDYQAAGVGFLLINYLRNQKAVSMDANMNPAAKNLAQRMGGRDIRLCYYLRRWIRPADALRGWRNPLFKVEECAGFDSRFDEFWQKNAGKGVIIGDRCHRILKWHYEITSTRKYHIFTLNYDKELVGYIIATTASLIGGLKKGIFIDYLFGNLSESVIKDFVLYVAYKLLRKRCICIDTVATQMYWPTVFKITGFEKKQETPDFMAYPNQITEGKDDLWNGKYWHLTLGDSDFYLP